MIGKNDRDKMNTNLEYWDEVVDIHAASRFYNLEGFKSGGIALGDLERSEVGDVAGRTLLHLQCHFGLDTLSWARLGAAVTGMDYSPNAIRKARTLAEECNIPARFIHCNLYDLPQQLDGQFDIVYTSYGVLCWLPDIREWARIAASYVKPGGFFYIAEFHPFAATFDTDEQELHLNDAYFAKAPTSYEIDGTYTGRGVKLKAEKDYEWIHPLGEIVSALIENGLQVEFLHEHAFSVFEQFPFLVTEQPGIWKFPQDPAPIPLMFSLRAKKTT
jgi:2-polyprenyl-3-methyl-5-hydroxy-6-metoxy-1,4-benzoquinol methylase